MMLERGEDSCEICVEQLWQNRASKLTSLLLDNEYSDDTVGEDGVCAGPGSVCRESDDLESTYWSWRW